MTPKELREYLFTKQGELNIDTFCTYLSALDDERAEMQEMFTELKEIKV